MYLFQPTRGAMLAATAPHQMRQATSRMMVYRVVVGQDNKC